MSNQSNQPNTNNDMVQMSTHEIAPEQWVAFLQTFTTEHDGWLASIGVNGRAPNHNSAEVEVRELPLRNISVDRKDRESTAVITLGAHDDESLTHEVRLVAHVRLTQAENDRSAILQIEGTDGQLTMLKVSAPALTDIVAPAVSAT